MPNYFFKFLLLTLLTTTPVWANEKSESKEEEVEAHEAHTEEAAGYRKGIVSRSDKDIKIPKKLVEKIEADYLQTIRASGRESVKSDVEIVTQISRKFLWIKVFLDGKNEGVLNGDTSFLLPRGGGVIDLSNYVNKKRGYFNVRFEVNKLAEKDEHTEELKNLKVYFVNNSVKRTIDKESYGAGCNQFFDLSSFYYKRMSGDGIVVNTTDQRYVSVLGGTFFFVLTEPEGLYLGSVTFEDSRFRRFFCR